MSFRLSPYKVARFIFIIGFLVYVTVEIKAYIQEKNVKTEEITKTLKIRNKDFYTNEETKKNLLKLDEKILKEEINEKTAENKEENKKVENQELNNIESKTPENQKEEAIQNEKEIEENKRKEEEKKKELEAQALAQAKLKEQQLKKAKEEAAKKQKVEQNKQPQKYIHASTVRTEAAAKQELARLGSGFRIRVVRGNSGKNLYQIVSVSTNDPKVLSNYESQARRAGTKYIVKTTGK